MSYARSAFRLLGLAETDDVRAIKRAYAAKLKAINPDEDVAGFQALRDALATATGYARYAAEQAAAGDADDDADDDYYGEDYGETYEEDDAGPTRRFIRPAPTASADVDNPPEWDADAEVATMPDRPPSTAELFIAALEAEAVAFPDKPPLDAEVSDGLMAAFQALLADPAYETVDGQEDLEHWLAHVLPQFAPWADGLLWRASYHFGWEAEIDKAQANWAFANAAQRARDVGVVVQLMRPDDPGHAAFMALNGYTSFSRLKRKDKKSAVKLKQSLAFHLPEIDAGLDLDSVGELERWANPNPWPTIEATVTHWFFWVVLIGIIQVAIRIASID